MKKTRKWEYVKQEATRLADLRLPAREIASRLGVDWSTVHRWVQQGKLPNRKGIRKPTGAFPEGVVPATKSPEEWAASVRAEYSLSETDDQLVAMAQSALTTALTAAADTTRLSAMRTFQGLVRQLALVAKVVEVPEEQKPAEEAKRPPARELRPTGSDPRLGMMVVK